MIVRPRLLVAAAVAAGLLVSSPAAASLRELTVTGTTLPFPQSSDFFEVFGTDHDIAGEAFTATWIFDSAAVVSDATPEIHGALVFPRYQSFVTALSGALTVGDTTIALTRLPELILENGGSAGANQVQFQIGADSSGNALFAAPTTAVPMSFDDDYFADSFTSRNAFDFHLTGAVHDTSIDGPIASLRISAVPEPASWALMLTGFLGAGAALRTRNRRRQGVGGPVGCMRDAG